MVKKILIVLGILILIPVCYISWYRIRAISEIKLMHPAETGQINEAVYAICDSFTNVYLIKDSNTFIAIDAGNDPEVVAKGLKQLQISEESITAVFLTHSDGDHVASLCNFPQAEIYLSGQEKQMINGETSRFLIFGNKICSDKYHLIKEQQPITLGNLSVKGILTQGHTPGSMCYLIDDKYLFTGDLISLKNGKMEKFNEFFNMDTKKSVESMRKIINLPTAEYIFTAHHGYTDDYKNAVSDWNKE